MSTPIAADDPYRELIALCRAGRLFEVDEWYKSGKPTQPPTPHRRVTPLGVAIDRCFYSLVEVLLRHGVKPTGRDLSDAVRHGRADIVDLLFRNGADANSVWFENVVHSYDPEIIRMFIERGADIETHYPFAEGFKTATKPLLGIYRSHVEKFPTLKFQASIALRHSCREGSMRSVSLLLWAGADPRVKVPEEYGDSEETWRSALSQAISEGHLDVAKKIGVDPAIDNLNDLLFDACFSNDEHTIRYIIRLGADPNARRIDGESPLNNLIWSLNCAVNPIVPSYRRHEAEQPIRCLKAFIELGGKWAVNDKRQISSLRSCFYRMAPGAVLDLVAFFKKQTFCPDEVIIALLNTPKMREHLRVQYRFKSLHKLIPFFMKWVR